MDIVPAILETDVKEFQTKLGKLAAFSPRLHIDFNDGSFEKTVSLTPSAIAKSVLNYHNKINFEAHLMVQKPYDYAPKLLESGFKKIIIPSEIKDNIRPLLDELSREEILVGLAVAPQTTVFATEPFWELLDAIIIMTVYPGRQNQPFLAENLAKVRELREASFPGEVQIDGGVDDKTISDIVAAKPDTIIVGHFISGSAAPSQRFAEMEEFL